jgi:DNA-binding NarL/FixJ family response regulator
LADDHPLVLTGLKSLISAEPDLETIGEATNGADALRHAIDLNPTVLVLDLWMPGLNGLQVATEFLQTCPRSRVLILTVLEDEFFMRKVLATGVAGYVLKRSVTERLTQAIFTVAAGGIYLDPAITARDRPPPEQLRRAVRLLALDAFGQSIDAGR